MTSKPSISEMEAWLKEAMPGNAEWSPSDFARLAYQAGWKSALTKAATIIRADKWPTPRSAYQDQYNHGLESLAQINWSTSMNTSAEQAQQTTAELPEAALSRRKDREYFDQWIYEDGPKDPMFWENYYTATQMHAFADAKVRAALEQAQQTTAELPDAVAYRTRFHYPENAPSGSYRVGNWRYAESLAALPKGTVTESLYSATQMHDHFAIKGQQP